MTDRRLFRGKRFPGGGWIEGYYRETQGYDCETLHLIHCIQGQCEDYLIDPATIGRCTGLPDKNGKLIFEGDVCKDSLSWVFEVVWDKKNARFIGRHRKPRGATYICYVGREPLVEIIGNIHDNPELLTQED